MSTRRRAARRLGGGNEIARALCHDALELLRAALDHRHEMDDALDSLGCSANALGLRDVAVDELAAPGLQRLRLAAVADERADVVIARAQRVDDLRPDEPVAAGDEDLHFEPARPR